MLSTAFTLFVAGVLTILLPCILPLVPVVLGVSLTGQSKARPFLVILGMVLSFVLSTFILQVVLNQFIELADIIRIATYDVLFLFGLGFLFYRRPVLLIGAALGGLFFIGKGWTAVIIAAVVNVIAMEVGGRVAGRLQQLGSDVQTKARAEFGSDSLLTAFIIGLTLGLVWVPCAGPALGFAFTLVRQEPGPAALLYLTCYGIGAALPLLLVAFGGQAAARRLRALGPYTGTIKRVAGALLLLSALGFQFNLFQKTQAWFVENTGFGTLGTRIEEKLFGDMGMEDSPYAPARGSGSSAGVCNSSACAQDAAALASLSGSSVSSRPLLMDRALPKLPKLIRAPEFTGLGPWHNTEPFTLASLKGKVVLVDFWTYSCINCIRTLPYIQGYAEKFKDTPFVVIGVHTPEFVFEKSQKNVAAAIKQHGLTYPVAQDNDFRTWDAFANRYWPAKYLIDADGYIRYTHFGEGAYDDTDLAIQSLLAEQGVTVSSQAMPDDPKGTRRAMTPETYLSSRSWPAFGNASQDEPPVTPVTYSLPKTLQQNRYYLDGTWQLVDDEREVLRSDTGTIAMKFTGSEINLVLGLEEGTSPVKGEVWIDGKKVKDLSIQFHDLYNLYKGEYGTHEVTLKLMGKGVGAYAFTFGSN